MTTTPRLKAFAAIAVVFCLRLLAGAATLQAKVVQVDSGNTLVVTNISRPLRVRLKAVAPPENGQPFSEAAREHLKALVLDKPVVIEYTHLAEGYLEAKVILNGVDIGSQMLRDGVAWFDRASDYELSASDRDLYLRCEQAARNEKRGLWQDPAAIAPWEFRKAQLAKLDEIVGSASIRQSKSARAKQTTLSNADLLSSIVGRGTMAGEPNVRLIAENGTPDRWTTFESNIAHFSIFVPSSAVEGSYSGPDLAGRQVAIHFVAGGTDHALYVLVFLKGPNENRSDVSAIDEAIRSLIGGMNQGARDSGSNAIISIKPVRQLTLGGYSGKQYILSAEDFSGAARVFTKQVGDQRELFVLFALSRIGSDPLGNQFINSFKIL